jgi:hypothetical protein
VSSPNLIRMSGLAATLAGTCFIVAELLTPITLLTNPNALRWIAVTDRFITQSLLTLIAAMLLLGGLVGLYVGQKLFDSDRVRLEVSLTRVAKTEFDGRPLARLRQSRFLDALP